MHSFSRLILTFASFTHQRLAAGASSDAFDGWLHGSKRSELRGEVYPAVGEIFEWRKRNSVFVSAEVDRPERRQSITVHVHKDFADQ